MHQYQVILFIVVTLQSSLIIVIRPVSYRDLCFIIVKILLYTLINNACTVYTVQQVICRAVFSIFVPPDYYYVFFSHCWFYLRGEGYSPPPTQAFFTELIMCLVGFSVKLFLNWDNRVVVETNEKKKVLINLTICSIPFYCRERFREICGFVQILIRYNLCVHNAYTIPQIAQTYQEHYIYVIPHEYECYVATVLKKKNALIKLVLKLIKYQSYIKARYFKFLTRKPFCNALIFSTLKNDGKIIDGDPFIQ